MPPENGLHQLGQDRAGQYAICVTDQWGVCSIRLTQGRSHSIRMPPVPTVCVVEGPSSGASRSSAPATYGLVTMVRSASSGGELGSANPSGRPPVRCLTQHCRNAIPVARAAFAPGRCIQPADYRWSYHRDHQTAVSIPLNHSNQPGGER